MKHSKWIAMILVLCIVACLMPARASAAEVASGTCGENANWSFSDDGVLTISGAGAIDDYLQRTDRPWDEYAESIESGNIGEGITDLGECAFMDCTTLLLVSLPDSLRYMGVATFENCSSLETISLPKGLVDLGWETFFGCTNLKTISIPDGITKIEPYTFSGCSSLDDVVIPDSVTYIGDEAFYQCSALENIQLPKKLTAIEYGTFSGCTRKCTKLYGC